MFKDIWLAKKRGKELYFTSTEPSGGELQEISLSEFEALGYQIEVLGPSASGLFVECKVTPSESV